MVVVSLQDYPEIELLKPLDLSLSDHSFKCEENEPATYVVGDPAFTFAIEFSQVSSPPEVKPDHLTVKAQLSVFEESGVEMVGNPDFLKYDPKSRVIVVDTKDGSFTG